MIRIKNDISYIDVDIPKGTTVEVLTKRTFYFLPPEIKRDLDIARHFYKKRQIQGVFAYLKDKWRWVHREDYE